MRGYILLVPAGPNDDAHQVEGKEHNGPRSTEPACKEWSRKPKGKCQKIDLVKKDRDIWQKDTLLLSKL